jgi:hypothetical protein
VNSYVLNKHQSAEVAQSVEQGTENPRVSGSIPFLGICFYILAFASLSYFNVKLKM